MGKVCLCRIVWRDNVCPWVARVKYGRGPATCLRTCMWPCLGFWSFDSSCGCGDCCKNKDSCSGSLCAFLFPIFLLGCDSCAFLPGCNYYSVCCRGYGWGCDLCMLQSRMALIRFELNAVLCQHWSIVDNLHYLFLLVLDVSSWLQLSCVLSWPRFL